MSQIENNRLIAEFMGLIPVPAGTKTLGQIKHPEESEAFLNYHEDWNLLMPVVEKIAKTVAWTNEDGSTDTYYPRTFGMLDSEGNFMVRINANTLHHDSTLIGATYKAVTDFIQWYNENKPQP